MGERYRSLGTAWRRLLVVLVATALTVAACGDDGVVGDAGSPDPPTPGEGQPIRAAFQRPFEGEFRLTNYFDHDEPLGYIDTDRSNGYQLNWQNVKLSRIEGHAGYDWLLPVGTEVLAVADGTVRIAFQEPPFECTVLGRRVDDHLLIELEHRIDGERFTTVYAHMSRMDVERGDAVVAGQVIGLSGNTGCSTEPHLHFQVWRIDNANSLRPAPVDPYGWDADVPDPWAEHPNGAVSEWMWLPGEAPILDNLLGQRETTQSAS